MDFKIALKTKPVKKPSNQIPKTTPFNFQPRKSPPNFTNWFVASFFLLIEGIEKGCWMQRFEKLKHIYGIHAIRKGNRDIGKKYGKTKENHGQFDEICR